MELLEVILDSFVNVAMLLFEYIGVGVITFSGIQGFINYLRRSPDTRLVLAKGLAMGLEFKLGSEILRTVIVRNLQEIGIVAGIILLRATLTFLIHWEIRNEENDGHASQEAVETIQTAEAVKKPEPVPAAEGIQGTAVVKEAGQVQENEAGKLGERVQGNEAGKPAERVQENEAVGGMEQARELEQ